MKKRLSIILALVMLIAGITGCAQAVSESTSAAEPETKSETSVSEVTSTEPAEVTVEPFNRITTSYYAVERNDVVLGFFPVNATTTVLQFRCFVPAEDEEIPAEVSYVFSFTTEDGVTYTHEEEDQNGDKVTITAVIGEDGMVDVSSSYTFLVDISGKYDAFEGGDAPEPWTVVEFLRNIPAAELGDFGLSNPYDDVVENTDGGYLHDITLIREDEYYDRFMVTDDFSAIFRADGESYKLIDGTVENLLNYKEEYVIYNEVEEQYDEFEDPLVDALVMAGTELIVGTETEVYIYAPVDLTESVTVTSSDSSVVTANGAEITAVAPGEAILTVTFVYGGFTKTSEIPVYVSEENPDEDTTVSEINDEKYTTYYDKVSQRAILEICYEDGLYSVEVLWADSAETMNHWSYIGTDDGSGKIVLNGSYYIENINDEFGKDKVVVENVGATLTLGSDGCYYWYDDNADAGKDCIFELGE